MLKIRKVMHEDCDLLLKWRNHPEVYKYALSPAPVSYDDHLVWFDKVLNNPRYIFYMGLLDGVPCGSVRYYLSEDLREAEVSISVSYEFWNQGIASRLMEIAEAALREDTLVRVIHATVLNDNIASLRLFNKAEFKPCITKFKKNI